MVENELLNAVKIAMEKRELKPYYQPQYDSITNKLSSAEALVRWIKEDGRVVLPGDYLPLLEKTEMICDLDWYMLDSVCQFIKRLMKAKVRVVPIAVNFSRKHVDEVI